MITQEEFFNLTKDGGVISFRSDRGDGSPISELLDMDLVFARSGITSKGRVWLQFGESCHCFPPLKDWTKDGCGISATGEYDQWLCIVAPIDHDSSKLSYGTILDDIRLGRDFMTEAKCLAGLGDDR